jgi:signal transduction histidine kinase
MGGDRSPVEALVSASDFVEFLTQACFVLIALVVARTAIREPIRARIDIAVFFAAIAFLVLEGWLSGVLGHEPGRLLTALNSALLVALPYLLIRLVNDFTTVPVKILRGAELGLILAVAGLFLLSPPQPPPFLLFLIFYIFGGSIYVAVAFFRAARTSGGVTQRRMQAVAAGTGLLGLGIPLAALSVTVPEPARDFIAVLVQVVILVAGIAYFLGFAPPPFVRRAWQEPELRSFLGRAASLPRLPDTDAIVRELERGAMASLGAPRALIGLWDEAEDMLRFSGLVGPADFSADQLIAGRAFATQAPIFSADAPRDDSQHAEVYRSIGATAVLAAPITAGQQHLGVLCVFAPRAPIFAEEDLRLVQLLADQAAVILESRALIDEAARVRAREEATRLKDDFLSAAAHDLKTPLTSIIVNAQLLERRAMRRPDQPADLGGIRRVIAEAIRLRGIVLELLDASRTEQGRLLGHREAVDLATLAREVGERHNSERHPVVIDAPISLIEYCDPARIAQLLENLVENAVKYSPDGGTVTVALQAAEHVELSVTDCGIGIPNADLPQLFARFHRGTNVDDRRFPGMGLGLYICRGIAEEHGGEIAVSSAVGQGTTFRVTLPRVQERVAVGIAGLGGDRAEAGGE